MEKKSKLPEWVVLSVEPSSDYSLLVSFIDGSKKRVDMRPIVAQGKIFEPLKDLDFFMRAKPDGTSVAWSDEIDIAPEYLYENGIDEN